MSDPQFFQTRMGQKFYEATVPALVQAVERLAENIGSGKPDPAVKELVDRAADLAAAADRVLDVEIVSGSEPTREAFDLLLAGAIAVRGDRLTEATMQRLSPNFAVCSGVVRPSHSLPSPPAESAPSPLRPGVQHLLKSSKLSSASLSANASL